MTGNGPLDARLIPPAQLVNKFWTDHYENHYAEADRFPFSFNRLMALARWVRTFLWGGFAAPQKCPCRNYSDWPSPQPLSQAAIHYADLAETRISSGKNQGTSWRLEALLGKKSDDFCLMDSPSWERR